jgi:MATE family multidrug resistance protein
MLSNLAGHWVLGLPVGYALCFPFGLGVKGLWVGLSVGLTLVGVVLVGVWARRVAEVARHLPVAGRAAASLAEGHNV